MPTTTDRGAKLAAVAQAIAQTVTDWVPGLNVYPYDAPGEGLPLPAFLVGAVELERPGVEEAESQLGSDDWGMTWTCTLLVALDDAGESFTEARRLAGRVIDAIDKHPTLTGEVLEAKLVRADMGYSDPSSPPRMIVVEMDLDALALMPTT